MRLPDAWPLHVRLLLLRTHSPGHVTAFFEDVSFFYPADFHDAAEWRWPPARAPSPADACGLLHLVDTTFTYGCAVADYSGCGKQGAGACGTSVGMDDVMRFLQHEDSGFEVVNDRCTPQQSLQSRNDARQLLRAWGGELPPPCAAPPPATGTHPHAPAPAAVTLLTDYMVARAAQLRRLYPADVLAVWLVEPRSICPSCYQHVADHAALFHVVLSHDIPFLSEIAQRHPNGRAAAAFVPFASTLLHPAAAGLHQDMKTRLVSCIVSSKRMLIGHVLRHAVYSDAFLRSRVHFFGHAAGQEIEHKTDAMAGYMFHIVIENSRARSYYSEKLIDCFLTGAIPLYWGGEVPSAFDHSGVITWNTLEDLLHIVSSLSADAYRLRLHAVTRNYHVASSGPYTRTLPFAWTAYLLPLAQSRASELQNGLSEARKAFQAASSRRASLSRAFVSDAADAVQAAAGGARDAKHLNSLHFWIVIFVDATMTIARLQRCLQQLQEQTHSLWHAILVIDSSASGLPDYRALLESHASDHRFNVWMSSHSRCVTMQDCVVMALNESSLVYDTSIDPVCFFLHGRDSLSSFDSLAQIAELYVLLNCWVTYGSSVILPSMTLEPLRDAADDDFFFPASVYEHNTARTTEWLTSRPPFFTALRSLMLQVPASHIRLPGHDGDPSLAILVAIVELAGDRVVPSIHVVHERWTSRSLQDAAAGGSELFHLQSAWTRRQMISELAPLRRVRGARMLQASSLSPKVSIAVQGGLLQPVGTTEVSVSVSASGIWIPEEALLRFFVDEEEFTGIGMLNSFVAVIPTVYGDTWNLTVRLVSESDNDAVLVEKFVVLKLQDDM